LIINIIFIRKQEKSDYSKKNNKKSNNQTIHKDFPIYSLGKRVYILEKVLHDVRKK